MRALLLDKDDGGTVTATIGDVSEDRVPEGEVTVAVEYSTVNYNAAEMGAGTGKVETLTDAGALEEIAAREGVDVANRPRIGGFVQGKRTAEIRDLDEVERRAAKIARRIGGRPA